MHRLGASLALAFFFVTFGVAQNSKKTGCRVRFAVVQKQDTGTFKVQPDDHDSWGLWPKDARQWWAKDGAKKYSELCEAAKSEAAFVVAWEKTVTERTERDPLLRDTFHLELIMTLNRVSVTLYRVEKEPQQFVPLSSLVKETFTDRGAGKSAFESALKTLRQEVRKSRRR